MKISTYKSFLTKNKTHLVLSIGKCGYEGYREAQVFCRDGKFFYIVSDGYNFTTIERGGNHNLKSIINIAQGVMIDQIKGLK